MSHDKNDNRCELCGEPMQPGESMFKYHGSLGPCPKPPLTATKDTKHDKTRPGYENFRKIAEQVAVGNSSLFRTKMTSDAVDDLIEDITACMCGVYEQGLAREGESLRTAAMGARRDAFAESLDLCDQFDSADDVGRGIRTLSQPTTIEESHIFRAVTGSILGHACEERDEALQRLAYLESACKRLVAHEVLAHEVHHWCSPAGCPLCELAVALRQVWTR